MDRSFAGQISVQHKILNPKDTKVTKDFFEDLNFVYFVSFVFNV